MKHCRSAPVPVARAIENRCPPTESTPQPCGGPVGGAFRAIAFSLQIYGKDARPHWKSKACLPRALPVMVAARLPERCRLLDSRQTAVTVRTQGFALAR